jgi:Bacterial capsule synthesis protein PGA_cap
MQKYLFVLAPLIFGLLLGGLLVYWKSASTENFEPILTKREISLQKPTEPKLLSVKMNTLFFGDVFWGRYIDDWAKASPLKTAYPFSGLSTFDRNKYDAWIADMECPITTTYRDSETQDSDLKFSCPTEYTSEAAKWFTAFTLANNHTDNMEEVNGLDQTRENLEKNKVQYFGSFDNSRKKDICEVVSLPARFEYDQKEIKQSTIPIALCGYHNVFRLPKEDELAVISEYSKYFPTIVMPHQGKEYTTKADELQTEFYRKMIDYGADAVIGDHVHSIQNTEAYKGKLIVYSLGNFIFDQQSSPGVREAFGVNLDFSFESNPELDNLVSNLPDCKQFKDKCLEKAKSINITKPKFKIKYDIIPTDNSNKLAKKATDSNTIDRVIKISNWNETLLKLDIPFVN